MRSHGVTQLHELSPEECRAHLRLADHGSLSIIHRALPLVVPVEIDDLGSEIRIRPSLAGRIPLPEATVVALEAGTFGCGIDEEWSVSVRGYLHTLPPTDPESMALDNLFDRGPLFGLSIELLAGWSRTRCETKDPVSGAPTPPECPIARLGVISATPRQGDDDA